jgi:hypothetical protein
MPGPAVHPRPTVPGVSAQAFQHPAAQPGQPGPDRQLRRLDALPAGQRPGHGAGQPGYLGGGLRRELRNELLAAPPYLYPAPTSRVRFGCV